MIYFFNSLLGCDFFSVLILQRKSIAHTAFEHCDTESGPTEVDAHKALETGNFPPICCSKSTLKLSVKSQSIETEVA